MHDNFFQGIRPDPTFLFNEFARKLQHTKISWCVGVEPNTLLNKIDFTTITKLVPPKKIVLGPTPATSRGVSHAGTPAARRRSPADFQLWTPGSDAFLHSNRRQPRVNNWPYGDNPVPHPFWRANRQEIDMKRVFRTLDDKFQGYDKMLRVLGESFVTDTMSKNFNINIDAHWRAFTQACILSASCWYKTNANVYYREGGHARFLGLASWGGRTDGVSQQPLQAGRMRGQVC